jgi:class 3 adenylate cyclase
MSLRYRLFFWMIAMFLIAGMVDYILEGYTSAKELARARNKLKAYIVQASEEKRERIEQLVASVISDHQAPLDLLLNRTSSSFFLAEHFAPTQENLTRGTWEKAAALLADNEWLDFIQNTDQGVISSLIIPRSSTLKTSHRIPIDEKLSWVILNGQKPLLGIQIPIAYEPSLNEENIPIPEAYLLFDPQEIRSPSATSLKAPIFQQDLLKTDGVLVIPWSQEHQISLNAFYQNFEKAHAFLLSSQGNNPVDYTSKIPPETDLETLIAHDHEAYMIWTIAAFFQTGIFGNDLLKSPAPQGIAVYQNSEPNGWGLEAKDVFFNQKCFDDQGYFTAHPPVNQQGNVASGIAVFHDSRGQVYLGNTAHLLAKKDGEQTSGYLSLAVNGNYLLQKLAKLTGETAIIVHQGQVFGMITEPIGGEIPTDSIPLAQMLDAKIGIVKWGEKDYFFSQITPIAGVDLHFILLNPVVQEFAFAQFLIQGANEIVQGVLFNVHLIAFSMMIVVLIVLYNIARRITKPITQLAKATTQVAQGRFDDAIIPHPPSWGKNDEVALLCHAFEEMVSGLKEKEKVKGVLNKVVSQEIAAEILKGNIHLGGEEKKVTVLFADIRDFTKMTQNMQPKEVIELLNMCMTKISFIIDRHGGVIDKYVGDETMALFGAPISRENSALQAIQSALEIVQEIKKWNEERAKEQLPSISLGIGIHTGNVLAGNMGAENRLNYTVIGSNVNLAARLCTSAEGMEIRISRETRDEPQVKEKIEVESLGQVQLKGFDHPVEVFRVKGLYEGVVA